MRGPKRRYKSGSRELFLQPVPGERGCNSAFFQQAAHIPTALGPGDAMKKIVDDSWQHQKGKALVSGLLMTSLCPCNCL